MKIFSIDDLWFTWRALTKVEKWTNGVFWLGLISVLVFLSRF